MNRLIAFFARLVLKLHITPEMIAKALDIVASYAKCANLSNVDKAKYARKALIRLWPQLSDQAANWLVETALRLYKLAARR
jgi:hypothetical protein